jgi:hypothetical protein
MSYIPQGAAILLFNARDMETVLACMAEDVTWANAWKAAIFTDAMVFAITGRANGR